jgi:DNA-binding response OmpR family regulator
MGAIALLVSQDPSVQSAVSSILADLGIGTEIFTDIAMAKIALQRARFAAVVVDCDLIGAEHLLELGDTPSNRTAVSFAVSTPGSSKRAVKASFTLSKPLQGALTRATMRAASSLIFSSYRRTFRCQLVVPVSLVSVERQFSVSSSNISMGGIAIQTAETLSTEERFRIYLVLPNGQKIDRKAKVVWTDKHGRAALLFMHTQESERHALQDWLDSKIQDQRIAWQQNKWRPVHIPISSTPLIS